MSSLAVIKQTFLHPLKMQWYNLQIAIGGAWSFFCKQQQMLEKKLVIEHYQERENTEDKSVVFTCNGWSWAGGLADRIKGMLTLYDWCARHHRDFQINFCEPFRLQEYLVPQTYDWLPHEIVYNHSFAQPRFCLMEPRTCGKQEVVDHQDELLESWMNERLSDKEHQLHVYTNMVRPSVEFKQRFHELFRPIERLQTQIDHHLQQIGDSYISISFRFTTLLGDFTDCTGAPLSEEKQQALIEKSLAAIQAISHQAPAHGRILVTADSEKFLQRAKEVDKVYVVPGKVGHIDYDHGDDVNMKTFLDFFLIGNAKAVYLAKGPGMYNSAFAKTAALVNGKTFGVYEY